MRLPGYLGYFCLKLANFWEVVMQLWRIGHHPAELRSVSQQNAGRQPPQLFDRNTTLRIARSGVGVIVAKMYPPRRQCALPQCL